MMDQHLSPSGAQGFTQIKLETLSPDSLSCKSDQSVDENIKSSITSGSIPSPCLSNRSDQSMDESPKFSMRSDMHQGCSLLTSASGDRSKVRKRIFSPHISNQAPSFASLTSNGSEDESTTVRSSITSRATPSPCLSNRSDHSMDKPPTFSMSLQMGDYLRCFICKEVMKEPVSIPCGHSFCRICIHSNWEKSPPEKHCCCPQCSKRFTALPELNLNLALDGLLKQPGPEDLACDICSGKRKTAIKFCLTCRVSFCETHVIQHYTVEALRKHDLTDVTEDLVKRTCQLHHRALEAFCKSDLQRICLVCVMESHKGHDVSMITDGSDKILKHEILKLDKHIEELTAKNKTLERAESELSHLTKRFCRGLKAATDFTSEFVEVAALGRLLDLGMLYDCCTDYFHSDVILWEKNLISSMKLSIPRPQTDVRVLEKDSLQERLAALDLSVSLRASVVSGLVEATGASAFINHPIQSELQDRVTVHYRTSSRLDMISHDLLDNGSPPSVSDSTAATHVVVAVLYGSQAFHVLDKQKDRSVKTIESEQLKDMVEKMIASSSQKDLLSSLTAPPWLFNRVDYIDGDLLENTVQNAVPLKVWLYPLKNLDQTSACVVKEISEDHLYKSEEVLEKLKMDINFCQHLMAVVEGHEIFTRFPVIKEALSEFCSLLQQHQSNFQKPLASCIKTIRETGTEEEEEKLRDLLDRIDRSPFSLRFTHQWLQNKYDQFRALIQCTCANIDVLNNQNDLQRFVRDCQADTVLCFTFTSLEGEDPFLSALRKNDDSAFTISDTSRKILSDLRSFISNKEKCESAQETAFIAASVADVQFPGCAVRLYQSGNLLSQNVQLDQKPETPKITAVQPTRVTMTLQSLKTPNTEGYRLEYRTVSEDRSSTDTKWRVVVCSEENCVVTGLIPGTRYQLRYSVTDSNVTSDYSEIIEFQTTSRKRPGPPTVLKPNKESLYIAWQRAESDEDSPVLRYRVEYLDAGLDGWQSFQTDGSECECTITLPHSNCYRVRVRAVYGNGDISTPSEETEIPVHDLFCSNHKENADKNKEQE